MVRVGHIGICVATLGCQYYEPGHDVGQASAASGCGCRKVALPTLPLRGFRGHAAFLLAAEGFLTRMPVVVNALLMSSWLIEMGLFEERAGFPSILWPLV